MNCVMLSVVSLVKMNGRCLTGFNISLLTLIDLSVNVFFLFLKNAEQITNVTKPDHLIMMAPQGEQQRKSLCGHVSARICY